MNVFQFVDGLLSLPAVASICFWATVAGVLSMLLYRRFSPQGQLNELMRELKSAQKEMNDYDGEFDGMLPLMKRTLRLSMKRVWMSLGPSLVAAIPLLLIMVGIGYQLDQETANGVPVDESTVVVGDVNSDLDLQLVALELVNCEPESRPDNYGFDTAWTQSWIVLFVIVSSCSALAVRQFGGII